MLSSVPRNNPPGGQSLAFLCCLLIQSTRAAEPAGFSLFFCRWEFHQNILLRVEPARKIFSGLLSCKNMHAKSRRVRTEVLAAIERKTDGEKRRANRSDDFTSGVKFMKTHPSAGFHVWIYLKCREVIFSASMPLNDAKRLCPKNCTRR